jgi:hypothetical protein
MWQVRRQAVVMAGMMGLWWAAGSAWGQAVENTPGKVEWQTSLFSGMFTGGTLANTTVNGEAVKVETGTAWLNGVRFGFDQEYFGIEGTVAGAFADEDLKAAPEAGLGSGGNTSLLLVNANLMVYPSGNDFADGRIKPFVTVGPGLAHLWTDFSQTDNETMFDWNAGIGVKFLLGENGNPVLRIDYRWYQLFGTGDLKSSMFRQELSIGLGIRF